MASLYASFGTFLSDLLLDRLLEWELAPDPEEEDEEEDKILRMALLSYSVVILPSIK